MKQLTQSQIVHRVSALIKGQKSADAVNALLMNISGIFENCGHKILRISIAGTFHALTTRMVQSLIESNEFDLTPNLKEALDILVETGPVLEASLPNTNALGDLLKAGLAARAPVNGADGYVAASYNGKLLYIHTYGVSTVQEAKDKKNQPVA